MNENEIDLNAKVLILSVVHNTRKCKSLIIDAIIMCRKVPLALNSREEYSNVNHMQMQHVTCIVNQVI